MLMPIFENYVEDIVEIVEALGYRFVSVSDDVYTFLDGDEKIGDVTYVTVDMVRREVSKTRHVFWDEWHFIKIELPREHEEVIKKLFKKY